MVDSCQNSTFRAFCPKRIHFNDFIPYLNHLDSDLKLEKRSLTAICHQKKTYEIVSGPPSASTPPPSAAPPSPPPPRSPGAQRRPPHSTSPPRTACRPSSPSCVSDPPPSRASRTATPRSRAHTLDGTDLDRRELHSTVPRTTRYRFTVIAFAACHSTARSISGANAGGWKDWRGRGGVGVNRWLEERWELTRTSPITVPTQIPAPHRPLPFLAATRWPSLRTRKFVHSIRTSRRFDRTPTCGTATCSRVTHACLFMDGHGHLDHSGQARLDLPGLGIVASSPYSMARALNVIPTLTWCTQVTPDAYTRFSFVQHIRLSLAHAPSEIHVFEFFVPADHITQTAPLSSSFGLSITSTRLSPMFTPPGFQNYPSINFQGAGPASTSVGDLTTLPVSRPSSHTKCVAVLGAPFAHILGPQTASPSVFSTAWPLIT
ncbi:hypothetical protein BV22DRAFT_913768 [Leucogyrophana mollusca]|uniref:Uncharacterized protein n=1 Tax=Leucogyrophana mollusca TaxID=85980 RepID=A0ACB8AZ29_9AGAM|nr:hypothetical protein BV22DRAFT_913768 [Leucogyrophana mollusca]